MSKVNNKIYDLIIIGGGPIGAITAYQLSKVKRNFNLNKIALIQKEPKTYPGIAYPNSGGSIRWYFEDKEIETATTKTAEFILKIKDKVDLSLIRDYYFFTHKCIFVPSLNISGAKLVDYLKERARKQGIEIFSDVAYKNFKKNQNLYIVKTNKRDFFARNLFFALGAKNKELFKLPLEIEKRQLFILDLNLTEEQKTIPHTILKIGKGIVFFFIKKVNNKFKLVLGQEDIYQHSLIKKPENYFRDLIYQKGVGDVLPFLKKAKVEKILWGFDVKNKKPIIFQIDENAWTINCGSAIRSLLYIGERAIEVFKYAK